MTIRRLALWVGALVALATGVASAQEVRLSDDDQPRARVRTTQAHPEGAYMGVVPGSPNRPPRVRRRASRALIVTWPGFQMTEGGSRVFLQLTQPVSVEEQRGVRTVTYTIRNARVPVRNNRRPLITTHFNTPVLRARLVQRRRNALLVVELRDDVPATLTQGTGPNGFHFLFIDFPPGTYAAPPEGARLGDDVPRAGFVPDDGTRPSSSGMVDEEQVPAVRPR